jgi:2-dehydro-3-deoxyphosphogluconate aldolase/(4S)-4-hydroxy-2-oxoglutarate aldolase
MEGILKKLGDIGIIPVIKLDSPDHALPLGKALLAGSLPVAEITFRTGAAKESIKILSKEFPDLIVGAGTVLTTEQVDAAVESGARYIVTPGFNPKVVDHCLAKGIPVTPGVTTPSQIEQALEKGLKILKFFPAENSGGVGMLKAFAGPYGDKVSFIPTGGVSEKNLADYLSCPNVHAVGGSWMVAGSLIAAGNFAGVEKLCREARMLALGFSLRHVGINAYKDEDSRENAKFLSAILGMPFKEGDSSSFTGKAFEIMHGQGRGEHGHIAVETLSIERALEWFSGFGIKPIEETVKKQGERISIAYLDRPFMGFAIHLNRK